MTNEKKPKKDQEDFSVPDRTVLDISLPTQEDAPLPFTQDKHELPEENIPSALFSPYDDSDEINDGPETPAPETSSRFPVKIPPSLERFFFLAREKTQYFGEKLVEKFPQSKKWIANLKQSKGPGQLRIDQFFKTLYAPQTRPIIHRYFIILLTLSAFYTIGKSLALLLKGQEKVPPPERGNLTLSQEVKLDKEFLALTQKNLFQSKSGQLDKSKKGPGGPLIDENVICKEGNSQTSLPLSLVSTVVLYDSQKSVVTLQMRSQNKLISAREGEKIENLARVDKIDRLKIILKNLQSGKCEFIANQENKGFERNQFSVLDPQRGKELMRSQKLEGISNEGNNYKISKNLIQNKLQDINTILTQARAIQMTNPDGSLAFKITEIEPGSIYSFLGINNDDVIRGINGKKITSLNEVMNLFGKVQNLEELQLTVERSDGTEAVLDYNFSQ